MPSEPNTTLPVVMPSADPVAIEEPVGSALPPEADMTSNAGSTPTPSTSKALLRELAETVVLTLVIFLLIRIVVQNFRVDGMSMEPNFHDGQFLLVNKLAYQLGDPQRGDVIVFHPPQDPGKEYIKRVVGLPGETIEIQNGQVVIDGARVPELAPVNEAIRSSSPVTLGPEELYVMGDNRPNSSDSRSWGPLPIDLTIGKVILSYWPPDSWGLVKHATARQTPTGQ